jgi:hypothetical protein
MLVKRLGIFVIITMVGVAITSVAAAAPGMTVTLGAPDLSARVSIIVPVTVSCSPFDPSLTIISESVFVRVEQASGNQIVRGSGDIGSGGIFGNSPTVLFPCDATAHTVFVTVLADPAGPPFHGGPALFSANAGASAGLPCFPGSTFCFINVVSQFAFVGPTALVMH